MVCQGTPMFLILMLLAVGLSAGWIAQVVFGDRRRIDWTLALIIGAIGSFVGGAIFSLLWGDGFTIRPSGIIGSIIGAIIVLAIYRAVKGSGSKGTTKSTKNSKGKQQGKPSGKSQGKKTPAKPQGKKSTQKSRK